MYIYIYVYENIYVYVYVYVYIYIYIDTHIYISAHVQDFPIIYTMHEVQQERHLRIHEVQQDRPGTNGVPGFLGFNPRHFLIAMIYSYCSIAVPESSIVVYFAD